MWWYISLFWGGLILLFAAFAGLELLYVAAERRRWRFSLRTLLVATTLVAVVLGLVVWFLGSDSDAREGAHQSAIGEGSIRAE